MIDTEQWRAKIGCFAPRSKKKNKLSSITIPSVRLALRITIALSLCVIIAGDVEKNPGPDTRSFDNLKETLLAAIDKLDTKINNLVTEVNDIKQTVTSIQTNTNKLKDDVARLTNENESLKTKVNSLESRLDDLEGRSRRNNLVFTGIKKPATENSEQCEKTVSDLLKSKMGMSNVSFERVHRIKTKGNTNPIIAKLSFHKDCRKILQNRHKLKGTDIFVNEDYTTKVRSIRQKLQPIIQRLREEGKTVKLVFDHLYVDGQRYDYNPDMNNIYKHTFQRPTNHDDQR